MIQQINTFLGDGINSVLQDCRNIIRYTIINIETSQISHSQLGHPRNVNQNSNISTNSNVYETSSSNQNSKNIT
jgi:hypothetical protein